MLDITNIKIKKIEKGTLLCYASILIQDSIIVDGIKLLNGSKGRYIVMPVRRAKKEQMVRNYAYPINNETREQLLELVSNEYDKESEVE